MPDTAGDQWAQWLLQRRHGGDPEQLRAYLDVLYPVRDRVLDNAEVSAGDVVLDVGVGDGLIAFGAIGRVEERGRVIFSDISRDLLDRCRALAGRLGVLDRCAFVEASAEDLSALPDSSVDAVTTRSVLIYVADKRGAFREFYRVLEPGGRISIHEPINRFAHPEPPHLYWGYDVTPVRDVAGKVRAVYDRIQPVDSDPMLDFDERDLLGLVEGAGFGEIHLELEAEIRRHRPAKWETFLRSSGNPRIPTLEEAMAQALTPSEAGRFAEHLRPLVEAGRGISRMAAAYVRAAKNPNG